jgi:stage V sporulation protein SpoVS
VVRPFLAAALVLAGLVLRPSAQSRPLVSPAALAEMIAAREITERQAMAIARGYLHDNAASLYK